MHNPSFPIKRSELCSVSRTQCHRVAGHTCHKRAGWLDLLSRRISIQQQTQTWEVPVTDVGEPIIPKWRPISSKLLHLAVSTIDRCLGHLKLVEINCAVHLDVVGKRSNVWLASCLLSGFLCPTIRKIRCRCHFPFTDNARSSGSMLVPHVCSCLRSRPLNHPLRCAWNSPFMTWIVCRSQFRPDIDRLQIPCSLPFRTHLNGMDGQTGFTAIGLALFNNGHLSSLSSNPCAMVLCNNSIHWLHKHWLCVAGDI